MERKHRRPSSGAALYAAIAVCLAAAGVGGYRILRGGADTARDRTSLVSAPARVPEPEPGAWDAREYQTDGAWIEEDRGGIESGQDDYAVSENITMPDLSENAEPRDNNNNNIDISASGGAELPDTRTEPDAEPIETALRPGGAKSGASATPTPDSQPENSASSENADAGQSAATPTPVSRVPEDSPRFVILPLDGETVTAFSMDELLYNETLRDWRTHDGIDIAAEEGTPVLAADAGTVESVDDDAMMGMTVVIRHEGTCETVYSCLGVEPEVEAGDEVSAGQVIGFVGPGGPAEAAVAPHLHFSVLQDGAAMDPADYLPSDLNLTPDFNQDLNQNLNPES